MKKIYLILVFIGLTGLPLMQSCTDLTEKVYDQIPTDQFGNTPKEIAALVGPVYNSVRNYRNIYNGCFLGDLAADMAIVPTRKGGDWWDGGQFMYIKEHTWTTNNVNLITGLYNDITGGITTCNKILSMIEAKTDLVGKEQIIAEIRGVRAFWYYVYIDSYGQGPLVTDFKDTKLPVSSTRKVLYEFVVSELNAVKDQLRTDVTSASYGKFTKGAAYALLAKMYLNAGVWNLAGGTKWDECIAACDVVLALPYVLEPDWKKSFQVKNEDSKEIIFPAVFKAVNGGNSLATSTLHYLDVYSMGLNIGANNGISADPDYIKEYDPSDKRLAWSFLLGAMLDPITGKVIMTAHGRPLIHTMDITKFETTGTNWGWCNQEDGARCIKWEIPKGLTGDMDNDYAIFRLADIYLMKAESLVRKNGNGDATATTLVNDVRRRVFSPEKPIASVSLEDIRKERRYEFAWEQVSRQDNIRFGTFLNAQVGWRPLISDPKYLLFPIPKTAMDVNPGLTQNPGY